MINILIILLYAIGNQFEVEIIGRMSISDIAILLFFLYLPTNRRMVEKLTEDKEIIRISLLYFALFTIQVISETILSNGLENSAKALAITILSYLKFIFLWLIISRKRGNILWLLLFTCIATILFKKSEYEASYNDIINNNGAAYLKFYLGPLIGDILVLITLLYKKSTLYFVFIICGIIIIILGARSMGLIIFLTGIIVLYVTIKSKIKKSTTIIWGIFISFCCYVLYIIYVNAVLSGNIISGNSSLQIKQVNNPYNPLEVLFMGRSENITSLTAISDSPWFGWGAWSNDTEYKYHILIARSKGEIFDKSNVKHKIIPSHSVIFGAGVNNGVFALLIVSIIIFYFCRRGYISIHKNNPYIFLVVYSILLIIWHGLFSPISHMRYDLPNYFVYCYFSYKWFIINKKEQKRQYKVLLKKYSSIFYTKINN